MWKQNADFQLLVLRVLNAFITLSLIGLSVLFGVLISQNSPSQGIVTPISPLQIRIVIAVNNSIQLQKSTQPFQVFVPLTLIGGPYSFITRNSTGSIILHEPGYYTGEIVFNLTNRIGNVQGQQCIYELTEPPSIIGLPPASWASLCGGDSGANYTSVIVPFYFYYNQSTPLAFTSVLTCQLFDFNDEFGLISLSVNIVQNLGFTLL